MDESLDNYDEGKPDKKNIMCNSIYMEVYKMQTYWKQIRDCLGREKRGQGGGIVKRQEESLKAMDVCSLSHGNVHHRSKHKIVHFGNVSTVCLLHLDKAVQKIVGSLEPFVMPENKETSQYVKKIQVPKKKKKIQVPT